MRERRNSRCSKRHFGLSIAFSIGLPTSYAQTLQGQGHPCVTDQDCFIRYNSNVSTCLADTGTCSNPFQRGCLYARLGKEKRLCNSDDDVESDLCITTSFNYSEIRIHNGNWETSVFMAWINQIVLMELAQVPATVGLTTNDTPVASFYSPYSLGKDMSPIFSSEMYPWDALKRGDQVLLEEDENMNSCSDTDLPCVQFLPEVWAGGATEYLELVEQEIVEPRTENGLLGMSGLHIPLVLAEQHPELSIWFGWKGEERRQFLAETFRRPLNWSDYCNQISSSQCQEPDETAKRRPASTEEGERYFVAGSYNGYFHYSSKNNCTANPTTCTGAIIGPPCDSANYVEGQLYYNGIVGLEMDGPLDPNGGYPEPSMKEIWFAANATKSPIIMYWYLPDELPVQFIGSDYQFQVVAFPSPSMECEANRPTTKERCSADIQERRGNSKGACASSIQPLSFIITKSIGDTTLRADEAVRSPAYETLTNFRLTNLDIAVILQGWQRDFDPRETLCDWVVDNLERLQGFVPSGYPRKEDNLSKYSTWFLELSAGLGGFATLVVLIALILCFKYRDTKTMVFTQPIFMMLILFGLLLVCVGAILYALKPTNGICTSAAWLIVQGYTIEMVAVLVKTSAINQLVHSSKKMKRVNIRRNVMLLKVLAVNLLVSVGLIVWTAIDPPEATQSKAVTETDGSATIIIDLKCSSTYPGWRMAALAWQILLLILAGVLAYQSRHVMEQLNESKSLAVMVYSHVLFVCLRGVLSYFYLYDTLPSSTIAGLFSLNFSLDSLFATSIYVIPKIYQAWKSPGEYRPGRFQSESRVSSNNKASVEDERGLSIHEECFPREEGDELKILVCTANLGNAEPTSDSIEAWIPPGGTCYRVNPLQGEPALHGTFDLIAIGMQEATWTDTTRKRTVRIEGQQMTEEEILNALEEKSTAILRELIQETLGDAYCQVADEQRGQMRLHLWAKRSILKDVMDVRISGANTGIGNVLANKGGIMAALYYRNTRISFLNAHLAAHEGVSYYKTRCDNVKSILREAKTFGLTKKFDDATSSHHMFIFGDLNFRTDFGTDEKHEDNINRARALISANNFEGLYCFDELQKGLASAHLLKDFATLPCHFPPTFKVERAPGFTYKEQRVPSYTDRILFKSARGLSNNLKPLAYEPCVGFISSDHKPIRGAFSLLPNGAMDVFDLRGDLNIVFRKMRCSNLPAGDSDGKSDPYIMFLWDSIDLETDCVTLMDKIREVWQGKSWPRTSYISKTLNPYWKGEQMHLKTSHTKIGYDAMLFLAVIDYDVVGKDEMLGCLALNIRELIKMNRGESTKTLEIDEDLIKEGKCSGRIKCKIDVTIRAGVPRMTSMLSIRNVIRRSNPNLERNLEVSSKSLSP